MKFKWNGKSLKHNFYVRGGIYLRNYKLGKPNKTWRLSNNTLECISFRVKQNRERLYRIREKKAKRNGEKYYRRLRSVNDNEAEVKKEEHRKGRLNFNVDREAKTQWEISELLNLKCF